MPRPKIIKTNCGHCGTKLTSKTWTHYMNKPPKRWHICDECYKKSLKKYAKKYNSKNKISKKVNAYTRLKAYRIFSLKLLDNKCQKCNKKSDRLQLHHFDGDWKNNDPNNLVMLCLKCHRTIHRINGDYKKR